MRTYYCLEMHVASYPANEIHVQNRPFSDQETNRNCYRVRASSRSEAEKLLRSRLNSERGLALQQLAQA